MELVKLDKAKESERIDNAKLLRDLADRVEAGDVVDFVVVGNDREEKAFMASGSFDDRWRMLGALEYAKQTVHEN